LDEINYDEIQVVMCTAHDEFALRAIRYQVVDYLLKPLEIQDLISTADNIEKKLTSTDGKQVFNAEMVSQFHSSNGKVPKRFTTWTDRASIDIVSVDDIVCVETHKGKVKTEVVLKEHGKNEYLLVNMSLLEMEKKLAPTNTFFRVSRTALVSINEIKSILRNVKYTIILSNGKKLYISRKGYRELIEFIEKAYETKD
jgi:two-component system LytT family response regulator